MSPKTPAMGILKVSKASVYDLLPKHSPHSVISVFTDQLTTNKQMRKLIADETDAMRGTQNDESVGRLLYDRVER